MNRRVNFNVPNAVHRISDEEVNTFFLLLEESKEIDGIIKAFRQSMGKGYDEFVKSEIAAHEHQLLQNGQDLKMLRENTNGLIDEAAGLRLKVRELVAKQEEKLTKVKKSLVKGLLRDGLIEKGNGELVVAGKSYVVRPNCKATKAFYDCIVALCRCNATP